jgi:hypothetical protein
MPLYPETIARCQHIKVNGTQCASPALRRRKFCHFHKQYRQKKLQINANIQRERLKITLPMLEDANSIQMGLAQVMRLLVTQQIDRGTAGTLLYALQTASCNLNRTSFEPQPTRVVIDPNCVQHRPIGTTAWSAVEGLEYDDVTESRDGAGNDAAEKCDGDGSFDQMLTHLINRAARNTPAKRSRAASAP